MSTDPVLSLKNVRFSWSTETDLINISEFSIERGQSVFLRGPSGSGKSTLLGLIGGVISPISGTIIMCGINLSDVSRTRCDKARADHLGIIFQQFNLLPYLDVVQNITLPCRFSKVRRDGAAKEEGGVTGIARHLAGSLGLSSLDMEKPVGELSVGQQQRVAVARALIGGPDLIIADEPTSALDHNNRDKFINLLNEHRKVYDSSLLFVSHDETLSSHFDTACDLSEINNGSAS
jgi:putative ABC transport system ATP-binding protein